MGRRYLVVDGIESKPYDWIGFDEKLFDLRHPWTLQQPLRFIAQEDRQYLQVELTFEEQQSP